MKKMIRILLAIAMVAIVATVNASPPKLCERTETVLHSVELKSTVFVADLAASTEMVYFEARELTLRPPVVLIAKEDDSVGWYQTNNRRQHARICSLNALPFYRNKLLPDPLRC